MVLHTWNQKLDSHVHVHALVPGGGPSLKEPGTWKSSCPPPHENQRRLWLVDADALRVKFRDRFLDGLRRLHKQGELRCVKGVRNQLPERPEGCCAQLVPDPYNTASLEFAHSAERLHEDASLRRLQQSPQRTVHHRMPRTPGDRRSHADRSSGAQRNTTRTPVPELQHSAARRLADKPARLGHRHEQLPATGLVQRWLIIQRQRKPHSLPA